MKIAIDTNAYANFCRGEPLMLRRIQESEHIFMPIMVLAELRAGFLLGAKASQNERNLLSFLSSSRVSLLFADEQTTHHYARLFRQLRQQGTPIPTNDLWIASLATQYDLFLCSNDEHFDHLPQLPRLPV